MPDAASAMYPSAAATAAPAAPASPASPASPVAAQAAAPLPPVAAEIAAVEAREAALQATLAKMYPTARAPDPKTGAAAATAEPDPAAEPAAKPAATPDLLYPEKPPTRGFVDFAELPAAPGTIRLDTTIIGAGIDTSAQGEKERTDLVAAFEAAGAGPTLANELFHDAYVASKVTYRQVSQEAGTAELKALWGERYDAKVAAARELVRKAAEKNPQVIDFLNQTKLGNDPKFIRKLAARAAAEASRKGRR